MLRFILFYFSFIRVTKTHLLICLKDQDYRRQCSNFQSELASIQQRLDSKDSENALLRNRFTLVLTTNSICF